jgi:oxalate decarboxylase/phosphoglucose isomerase-like protein (cupin superfamily)
MELTTHKRPAELKNTSLETLMERYTAHFKDLQADWKAFPDSQTEGFRRAQHRYIGAGGSGRHNDTDFIPPDGFTVSVMFIPPGQGGSAHTHEITEAFFVLEGVITMFMEDENGRRVSKRFGKWDCIACPPGVIHGFVNDGVEPVYLQTLIASSRPGPVGFVNKEINKADLEKHQGMRSSAPA